MYSHSVETEIIAISYLLCCSNDYGMLTSVMSAVNIKFMWQFFLNFNIFIRKLIKKLRNKETQVNFSGLVIQSGENQIWH